MSQFIIYGKGENEDGYFRCHGPSFTSETVAAGNWWMAINRANCDVMDASQSAEALAAAQARFPSWVFEVVEA